MKSTILLVVTFINFSFFFSQKKYSLGLYYSYNLSAHNSFIGEDYYELNPDEIYQIKLRGSLGAGYNLGLVNSLHINENFSFNLNLAQFTGNSLIIKRNLISHPKEINETRLVLTKISPSVTFSLPTNKITFFMTNGIILPVFARSKTQSRIDFSDTIIEKEEITKYYQTWGFVSSVGFKKRIINKFFLSSEFGFELLSLSAKAKRTHSIYVNNVNAIGQYSNYELNESYLPLLNNFSNNLDYNKDAKTNLAKDVLTYSQNLNTVFLKLSISYNF